MDETRPLLIGGEWVRDTGLVLDTVNPATGQAQAAVAAATANVVDDAVAVARRAVVDPAWRGLLPHQRGRMLARLADVMASRADVFARAQMAENGKPHAECKAQAAAAEAIYRYYAAVCETTGAEVTPPPAP
ncbi:MAG: aldehyde dehydrogenase family protein, partial [Comamonadaceae bacterium]